MLYAPPSPLPHLSKPSTLVCRVGPAPRLKVLNMLLGRLPKDPNFISVASPQAPPVGPDTPSPGSSSTPPPRRPPQSLGEAMASPYRGRGGGVPAFEAFEELPPSTPGGGNRCEFLAGPRTPPLPPRRQSNTRHLTAADWSGFLLLLFGYGLRFLRFEGPAWTTGGTLLLGPRLGGGGDPYRVRFVKKTGSPYRGDGQLPPEVWKALHGSATDRGSHPPKV